MAPSSAAAMITRRRRPSMERAAWMSSACSLTAAPLVLDVEAQSGDELAMPLDDPGADERGRGNPLTERGRVPAQRRGGLPAVRRPPQARGQAQVGSAGT